MLRSAPRGTARCEQWTIILWRRKWQTVRAAALLMMVQQHANDDVKKKQTTTTTAIPTIPNKKANLLGYMLHVTVVRPAAQSLYHEYDVVVLGWTVTSRRSYPPYTVRKKSRERKSRWGPTRVVRMFIKVVRHTRKHFFMYIVGVYVLHCAYCVLCTWVMCANNMFKISGDDKKNKQQICMCTCMCALCVYGERERESGALLLSRLSPTLRL